MAALGEPVAPAADAEPMMPFSQDGELEAACMHGTFTVRSNVYYIL